MTLRRNWTLTFCVAVLFLPLGACSGLRELAGELGELNRLQSQLQQQTGQTSLNVNLNNGRYLSVSFINSPLAKLPADQKNAKARDVARLAYNDWPRRTELVSVSVIFQSNYDVGPIHYSNSLDNFEFHISELATDETSAPSVQPPGPIH